ncbi:MAG: NAD(P)H-binding protein [Alphaproteobacteria bacterium]|nr:NAD(P)H-binding protein [Alphaproteobacteria bacterium]
MTKTVLVAGASGWLGRQIAEQLIARGARVRLMLRGGAGHLKAAELASLTANGAVIVDADVGVPESLPAAAAGVDAIVSALQGGPDVIVDGQARLAAIGRAAGAQRFVASDYSVRFDGVTEAEHLFLGWRTRARAAIAASGIAQINPLNGAFTEMLAQPFFGLVDWRKRAVTYWGDADQPYDFTTTADTAAYVAAAAVDEALPAGELEIAGDTQSPRALTALLGDVTGRSFDLVSLGNLAALDAEIARRQAASPHDPTPWAGLQYHRLMASGAGKLRAPQNARFGDITPMTVKQWLCTRKETG